MCLIKINNHHMIGLIDTTTKNSIDVDYAEEVVHIRHADIALAEEPRIDEIGIGVCGDREILI